MLVREPAASTGRPSINKTMLLRATAGVLVLALALAMPSIVQPYTLLLIAFVLAQSIGAASLTVLTGFSGQVSLGHGGLFGASAYLAVILHTQGGLHYVVATLVTALIMMVVGLAIGIPSARISGPYLAVVTLTMGLAITELLLYFRDYTGGYDGLFVPPVTIFGVSMMEISNQYYFALAMFVVAFGICYLITRGPMGRAWQISAANQFAARAMGVNVELARVGAFAFSGLLVGLGGAAYAPIIGALDPSGFGFWFSVYFLVAIVVGGLRSLPGAVLGTAVIVGVPEYASGLPGASPLLLGAALVLMLRFWPSGLMGVGDWLWARIRGATQSPSARESAE